LKFSQNTK